MINLNATPRYLILIAYTSIYTICMTVQAVKLIEHKLSHLDYDATKDRKTKLCGF